MSYEKIVQRSTREHFAYRAGLELDNHRVNSTIWKNCKCKKALRIFSLLSRWYSILGNSKFDGVFDIHSVPKCPTIHNREDLNLYSWRAEMNRTVGPFDNTLHHTITEDGWWPLWILGTFVLATYDVRVYKFLIYSKNFLICEQDFWNKFLL